MTVTDPGKLLDDSKRGSLTGTNVEDVYEEYNWNYSWTGRVQKIIYICSIYVTYMAFLKLPLSDRSVLALGTPE